MRPARKARERSGQISLISATPSDHSPPMPRARRKTASTPICQAAVANPPRLLTSAYVRTLSIIGTHAADAVAQPAEQDAAGRSANQEKRGDDAEPGRHVFLGNAQILKAGPATSGNSPISRPSNSQPNRAAVERHPFAEIIVIIRPLV